MSGKNRLVTTTVDSALASLALCKYCNRRWPVSVLFDAPPPFLVTVRMFSTTTYIIYDPGCVIDGLHPIGRAKQMSVFTMEVTMIRTPKRSGVKFSWVSRSSHYVEILFDCSLRGTRSLHHKEDFCKSIPLPPTN